MNFKHDEIEITQPAPGRYQITGYRAMTVYIPDVGNLSPPQIVDLPMTPDLADALRAVLDDYQPGVPAPVAVVAAPVAAPPRKIIRRKRRAPVPMIQHEQGGAA